MQLRPELTEIEVPPGALARSLGPCDPPRPSGFSRRRTRPRARRRPSSSRISMVDNPTNWTKQLWDNRALFAAENAD